MDAQAMQQLLVNVCLIGLFYSAAAFLTYSRVLLLAAARLDPAVVCLVGHLTCMSAFQPQAARW